jgi:hypothetical protein
MTTKHTPGPWEIFQFGEPSEIDVAVGPVAGGVAVAQIVTANGQGINTREAIERGAANARLIAAAPDMLKALYRLTHPAADDTDLEFALQVIDQATGGNQ